MGISSLGVGSSILTQDVLDQLRAADEAGQIVPVDLSIANENDKKDALKIIDANMQNLIDSIDDIKRHGLYDEREATVSGSSVEVSAIINSDVQEFSLDVITLATKQIEQSGAFGAKDEKIAAAGTSGTFDLNIDGASIANITYDEETSLEDLKNLINNEAGDKVSATIIQINDTDFRLFISSVETGDSQDISISDNGTGLSANLDGGMSTIQTGVDSHFQFNGQDIYRSSNVVDDLASGLTITLKEVGSSDVSVAQNRDTIMEKFDNFMKHYNAAVTELDKMTKASVDSDEKGIFSGESTIKNMKRTIESMVNTIGGGVGYINDYGFDIDKDGEMTLDKDVLNTALDTNPQNVEAFFAGGTFTNADSSTTEVDGAFTEFSDILQGYTNYNATLDLFTTAITDKISALEDKKITATERLDAKYAIMKKQYAAYDLMISKLSSASSMFTQMANTENSY